MLQSVNVRSKIKSLGVAIFHSLLHTAVTSVSAHAAALTPAALLPTTVGTSSASAAVATTAGGAAPSLSLQRSLSPAARSGGASAMKVDSTGSSGGSSTALSPANSTLNAADSEQLLDAVFGLFEGTLTDGDGVVSTSDTIDACVTLLANPDVRFASVILRVLHFLITLMKHVPSTILR